MDEKAYQEWVQGERPLDVWSDRPEGSVAFQFSRESGRPVLRTARDRSSPQATDSLIGRLASPEGETFTVKLRTFHMRLRDLAYLYHAHLTMFDYFGYEYALSEHVKRVQGILTERERPDLRSILRVLKSATAGMPKTLPAVNVATSDNHAPCFFVTLPAPLPWEKARGVLLPGPTPESEEYFNRLVETPAPFAGDMQLTYVSRKVLLDLDDPDSKGQMHYLFSTFQS